MNWLCEYAASANTPAPPLLSEAAALGDDPNFPCPLPIPWVIRRHLVVVCGPYYSFHGDQRTGQIVVHEAAASDMVWILHQLCLIRFPIASMAPIAAFDWSDERSMAANNTSGFNHRFIAGTNRLSRHAYGLASDFNPVQNPCCSNGVWVPPGARYDPSVPGTITADSKIVALFRACGWIWGGHWKEPFDPQHFFKPHPVF